MMRLVFGVSVMSAAGAIRVANADQGHLVVQESNCQLELDISYLS